MLYLITSPFSFKALAKYFFSVGTGVSNNNEQKEGSHTHVQTSKGFISSQWFTFCHKL